MRTRVYTDITKAAARAFVPLRRFIYRFIPLHPALHPEGGEPYSDGAGYSSPKVSTVTVCITWSSRGLSE